MSEQPNVSIHELHYKIQFGVHKGKTIKQMLEEKPDYIRWCFENIDWFDLSQEAYEALKRAEAAAPPVRTGPRTVTGVKTGISKTIEPKGNAATAAAVERGEPF